MDQMYKILQDTADYPETLYNAKKRKLEDEFKEGVKELDAKLQNAKRIPSFAWYIFDHDDSDWTFFKMLDNNYIDDIRAVVKEWLEYTNEILKEPKKDFEKLHKFPYYISSFMSNLCNKVLSIIMFDKYNKLKYLKEYVVFYEQTIEPCFELQEKITQQIKELEKCFKNNPLPNGSIDIRYFCYNMVDICEYSKKSHQKQYKKSKKIIQRVEKIEKAKLLCFKIFKRKSK